MATRPVVSYEDITLPYDQPVPQKQASSSQPPPKKRKKNNQKGKHWDDPSRSNNQRNAANSQRAEFLKHSHSTNTTPKQAQQQFQPQEEEKEWDPEADEGEYEEYESRELTHEEIWDDSALVDAWESAMEEYHAFNGSEKDWKKEPVKKSPLWYNVPVDPSKELPTTPSSNLLSAEVHSVSVAAQSEDNEVDSRPLDFDTFVPTYDASLPHSSHPVSDVNYVPDTPAGLMVSQDEAFSRALSAMYWGGYWTAMYHAQRHYAPTLTNTPVATAQPTNADEEDDLDEVEDIKVDDDDFVSTQR